MIAKTYSNSLLFLYANSFDIIEIVFIAIGIALLTRLFIKGVFEDCQYIQDDAKLNTDKKQKQFKLSEEERLKLLTEINTKLNSSLSYTNKTGCKAKGILFIIIII